MAGVEVVIVGSGIVGAACAYGLAERGVVDVAILDREDMPNRHSSGRNAAYFLPVYDGDAWSDLAQESLPFFRDPPDGFSDAALLGRQGAVVAALAGRDADLEPELAGARRGGIRVDLLGPDEIVEQVPIARPERFGRALSYPDAGPLDVHALSSGYLRRARRAGIALRQGEEVVAVETAGGRVTGVRTRSATIACRVLVDAAGAWAGEIGRLAGAAPIAFTPCRRHIAALPLTADLAGRTWPFFRCPGLPLYFKPESGQLLASLMDKVPDPPGDCQTDDLEVAAIADTVADYTTLPVRRITRAWAGHRTFGPQDAPVIGPDAALDGFVWAAGLGGAGVMTSPAIGRRVADAVLEMLERA